MKGDYILLEVVYIHIFLIKLMLNDFCDDSQWKIQFVHYEARNIYLVFQAHL